MEIRELIKEPIVFQGLLGTEDKKMYHGTSFPRPIKRL